LSPSGIFVSEVCTFGVSRDLKAWLKSKGIEHESVEPPGAHTWMVWRRNLTKLAPLLFQAKK
jgi:enterochelin esterase-like enzyme